MDGQTQTIFLDSILTRTGYITSLWKVRCAMKSAGEK